MTLITKLYLNPYCTILATKEYAYLYVERETQIFLEVEKVRKMLEELPSSAEKLATIFTLSELQTLLQIGVLREQEVQTENFDSVNRGWFISLKEEENFDEIKKKTVLILGCGGLGSHAAWAMTALGVEKLILVDNDTVAVDNLNRQLLYTQGDIGNFKVESLKTKLMAVNPHMDIFTYKKKIINPEVDLGEIILEHGKLDLVIKAVDSPENHVKLFSDYFSKMKIPYTSGGTLGNGFVLGPTYHPQLKNEYKKEIQKIPKMERLHIKGISLPMIMEKIAAEVNIEALHLLTGKLENIRFNQTIKYEKLYPKTAFSLQMGSALMLTMLLGGLLPLFSVFILSVLLYFVVQKKYKIFYFAMLLSGAGIKGIYFILNDRGFTVEMMIILLIFGIYSLPVSMYAILLMFRSHYWKERFHGKFNYRKQRQ